MKKLLIAFSLIILSLLSCSEDKIKVFIDADNTKNFSEIEKKGIETKITELSDREAYREIREYLSDRWTLSSKNHLELMGSDVEAKYKKIADDDYKDFEDAISVSKKLKGKQIYYKAESIKLNSKSDTAYFKVFYFDNNKSLIKEIHYK
jgi:hypothetical protein